jgi:hypothetical protein
MKCEHRVLVIDSEPDGCTWVLCQVCGKTGPHKHSITLALLAWIVRLSDERSESRHRGHKEKRRRLQA